MVQVGNGGQKNGAQGTKRGKQEDKVEKTDSDTSEGMYLLSLRRGPRVRLKDTEPRLISSLSSDARKEDAFEESKSSSYSLHS